MYCLECNIEHLTGEICPKQHSNAKKVIFGVLIAVFGVLIAVVIVALGLLFR